MFKKEDLDKLPAKLGPLFYIPVLIIVTKGMTYLIVGATNLVEYTYQLGYSFGSMIEKFLS